MGTGLDAQIGFVNETTYGTPVTVTRFYEFLSESVKNEIDRYESQGLRSGARVQRSGRWASGHQRTGGDVEFELGNKSYGLLLEHMFGTVATTTPTNGVLTRDHTFTPGSLDAKQLTCQIGRPPISGAVQPFTYHGCNIGSWSIEVSNDAIPKLTISLLGEEEDTATALAAASYPSGFEVYTFTQVSLDVAGSSVDVYELNLEGNNTLKDDRYPLGTVKRRKPLEVGLREYTGSFRGEFESLTQYNRFVNGTEAALVITMWGDDIEAVTPTYRYELKITCNVRFDGETPSVGGPELLEMEIPFKCLNTGANDGTAITCVYRTTDTAP